MHEETSYVSLLIVIALAAIVPVVTTQIRKVRIPVVVGEILAGMIVGRSGFNLVGEDPWLEMLSTLGFAYLMFLSGLEVDFDAVIDQVATMTGPLRERLRSPLVIALLSFALTLFIALAFALGLQSAGRVQDALLMALILSTTSLGLVVPILKERGELRTPYGQTLLLASLVADFATMLLISIYVIFHTSGLTLEMLLVLVLLGAFVSFYRLLLRAQRHPPLEQLFFRVSNAASHMPVRAAFAIGLAFIALAEQLGVEAILGAFLGGALIALLSREDESPLRHQLDAMGYNFFIPMFFIMVGVRFDLPALLSSPETLLLAPILLAIAYAIKLVSGLVFSLNYDWRKTVGAGLLLSSRLSLIIAAAAIGMDLGAITEGVNADIILLAIITCTASPLLFNRLVPAVDTTPEAPLVVVGGHQGALTLAERLAKEHESVILAVPAKESVKLPDPADFQVVQLPEISQEALRRAGLGYAKALVALCEEEGRNLRLSQIASAALRIPNVVAQVNDPANMDAYIATGATPVSFPEAQVTVLENLASNPNVFRLLTHSAPNQRVVELAVESPHMDGSALHGLPLPDKASIMVIQRDGRYIAPRGDTRLALGDVVTVLAAPDDIDQVCRLFTCG
jgi:Kef-type K+ transport system membrane component KefB